MSAERDPPPRGGGAQAPQAANGQQDVDMEQQAPPSPAPEAEPATEAADAEMQDAPAATAAAPQPEETTTTTAAAAAPIITPGVRAGRFQQLFASVVARTLDKIDRDNFAACFPTIRERAPGTLEFVQRQMVERLGGLWNKEFETILANRQVVARLNELEQLVTDAARRRDEAGATQQAPVAPHTLPAETILDAHLRPHLASLRSQLNAKLQNVQAANARLHDEVQAQRAEMERLLGGVEKALADVDGASGLLGEVVDELAEETRAAEREVERVMMTAGLGG